MAFDIDIIHVNSRAFKSSFEGKSMSVQGILAAFVGI